METIRIRLSKDHKDKLQQIADRDFRSITGTIRKWIESDDMVDKRAHQLFASGAGGNTRAPVASNKEYIR